MTYEMDMFGRVESITLSFKKNVLKGLAERDERRLVLQLRLLVLVLQVE